MEEQLFNRIRQQFCQSDTRIKAGKMMSSEAIKYQDKVFAFFSRQKKMVFKLGAENDLDRYGSSIQAFNPFKKKGPLKGWYEVAYSDKELWEPLAERALSKLKGEL